MQKPPISPGARFGRLTVICRDTGVVAERNARYLCRCECGGGTSARADKLRSGSAKECLGCHRASRRASSPRGSPWQRWQHNSVKYRSEYNTWTRMRSRCGNPKDLCFRLYGGRGITVCGSWVAAFEAEQPHLLLLFEAPGIGDTEKSSQGRTGKVLAIWRLGGCCDWHETHTPYARICSVSKRLSIIRRNMNVRARARIHQVATRTAVTSTPSEIPQE